MNAQFREMQRAYDNQSPPEPQGPTWDEADQKIRDNDLRMAELISEVADISDDNWLIQALVHYHRTGDGKFLLTQCDKHIEPVIDGEVQKEMERRQ